MTFFLYWMELSVKEKQSWVFRLDPGFKKYLATFYTEASARPFDGVDQKPGCL